MAVTTGGPDDEKPGEGDNEWESLVKRAKGTDNNSVGGNFFGPVIQSLNLHGHDPSRSLIVALKHWREHRQERETLASKREGIYLGALNQKSRHVEVNFWLSVLFIVVGVIVIAAGPIVALIRAEYLPLIVSLFGVPFAAVGGVLAVHVRQSSVALDARVDRIEQRIDEDARWEKATKLIDTLETPERRDQVRAEAARWMLTPRVDTSAAASQPPEVEAKPKPKSEIEAGAEDEPGDSKP